LKPNETKTVAMWLKADNLAYWDVATQKFIIEKDKIELQVGSSSQDIRLTQMITIN
jgi:beta-glucosidase